MSNLFQQAFGGIYSTDDIVGSMESYDNLRDIQKNKSVGDSHEDLIAAATESYEEAVKNSSALTIMSASFINAALESADESSEKEAKDNIDKESGGVVKKTVDNIKKLFAKIMDIIRNIHSKMVSKFANGSKFVKKNEDIINKADLSKFKATIHEWNTSNRATMDSATSKIANFVESGEDLPTDGGNVRDRVLKAAGISMTFNELVQTITKDIQGGLKKDKTFTSSEVSNMLSYVENYKEIAETGKKITKDMKDLTNKVLSEAKKAKSGDEAYRNQKSYSAGTSVIMALYNTLYMLFQRAYQEYLMVLHRLAGESKRSNKSSDKKDDKKAEEGMESVFLDDYLTSFMEADESTDVEEDGQEDTDEEIGEDDDMGDDDGQENYTPDKPGADLPDDVAQESANSDLFEQIKNSL